MPKPKKQKLSNAHRKAISEGLRRYWQGVHRIADALKTTPLKARKKISRNKDISKTTIFEYLKTKKLKGGKKNSYTIVLSGKTKKGKTFNTSIKGVSASRSDVLKNEINRQIGVYLKANGHMGYFETSTFYALRRFKSFRVVVINERGEDVAYNREFTGNVTSKRKSNKGKQSKRRSKNTRKRK